MVYKAEEFKQQAVDIKLITDPIDQSLRHHGKASLHVHTLDKLPDYIKNQTILKITKEYTDAGWHVERVRGDDQREGKSWDYLSITLK